MIDLVRDTNPFAPSRRVKGAWEPAGRRQPNGRRTAWRCGSLWIKEAHNGAGLLCFRVTLANGKHCYQSTLAEAQEYAEAQNTRNIADRES